MEMAREDSSNKTDTVIRITRAIINRIMVISRCIREADLIMAMEEEVELVV
jgi:hypothetical protein